MLRTVRLINKSSKWKTNACLKNMGILHGLVAAGWWTLDVFLEVSWSLTNNCLFSGGFQLGGLAFCDVLKHTLEVTPRPFPFKEQLVRDHTITWPELGLGMISVSPRQIDHPEKLGSPKCRHGQSCQMACHTRQLRARFSGHFQMWLALIETGALKESIHWKGTKIHHNTICLFGCSEGACLWIYGNSSPLICSNFQGCSCTSRAIWSGSFLRGRWRMSRDGGRNLAHLSTLHLRYDMMRHDMLRHLCYDSMILWCYVTSNDLMCYKITWDFSSALVCHVKTLQQAKKWQHAVALLQELKAESRT